MYKISVPVSMETVTEESLPRFAALLRQMGAQRVFLCVIGEVQLKNCMVFTQPERLRQAIAYFRNLGLEVGIWVNAFGHGELLAHQTEKDIGDYTPIEDAHGGHAPVAFCPLDKRFREDYFAGIRALAQLKPDIIMLDDDLRFNFRRNYFTMGCFCPAHLKWFYRLVGEELPRADIERFVFGGKPNKYRDAFLGMMGQTLLDFAKELRSVVDEIDPTIRMGASVACSMWDSNGTDTLALAKAFAGNTKPFARIAGAPYHNVNILPIIERARQQCAWGKDSGVELFCEGDTYPRPRYNVPARTLELFDLAMACDGSADGMLQYVFDYTHSVSYEDGYAKRLGRNRPLREAMQALFAGKRTVGVQVFDVMHKLAQWELPEVQDGAVKWLQATPSKGFAEILSRNSIPTAYEETELPVLVIGENGRHVPLALLGHGAILDAEAARLLQERGVDTGLLEICPGGTAEHFEEIGETVLHIGAEGKLGLAHKGVTESVFLPSQSAASYRYENQQGQRFFVLGCSFHTPGVFMNANYLCAWARRRQLQAIIPWLCGKALPAVLADAPEAHLLVKRSEKAMAVAITNSWYDEILEPVIRLDGVYDAITCINCTGRVEGDRVYLDSIAPYSFAAFEVTKK